MAPGETPQEEATEPVSENDSETYPEDDIPEEEDEEEDEEDDDYEEDYKVDGLNPKYLCLIIPNILSVSHSSVLCKQSPPSTQTQDKKDDDSEGTMPPYDPQTQELIDGKRNDKTS